MRKRTGKTSRRQAGFFSNFLILLGKPFYYGLLIVLYTTTALVLKTKKITKAISKKVKDFHLKKHVSSKVIFPKYKIKLPKVRLHVSYKLISFLLGVLLSLNVFFFILNAIFKDLPSPQKLSRQEQSLTTKIYDRNNNLLYKIYSDQNRTPVLLSDLPEQVKKATISIEDKDFYHHNGLSWRGILRAAFLYIFEGKTTGGSTITQQLVKNTLLTSEKTLRRKIKEAVLAVLVEKKYSKDQILEMYLNQIGYGGAAYGIEEASQKYFNIPAKNLNLTQAALLAGLTASPTRYSPFGSYPQNAKERQILVLKRMLEDGSITKDQEEKALNEPLNFAPQSIDIKAPHFVMYVKELLVAEYGEKTVETGGLEVMTSIDLKIQEEAQEIVRQEIKKLGDLHITNGAALITNPKTGEILAMVGSKDYFAPDIQGNFNVTTALRQPGSSIKPVNYSIALENGFTPATLIEDSPITYQVPGQPPYSPKNYDSRYHGQVPLRIALGSSYNVPAVKVLAAFGVNKMIQRGKEMGITTWNDPSRYGLSLTLGGGEVKMTDMAVVYGVLANNGVRVNLNPILEVKDSLGKILIKNSSGEQTPALNPGVAFLLTNILADNFARTPAFGPNSMLNIQGRAVAVKTGTTQNMRDNWTIGYTPTKLAAVWVGNNDNTSMSYVASGITGASPIWRKIMDSLLQNSPIENFPKPDEIKEVDICSLTGTLSCEGCPNPKREYFLNGTEPKISCSMEKIKEILEKKSSPPPNPQIL